MAVDWYRKTTWLKEDEEEFFQKLKRAQKFNRPQYLIIQAVTLYRTNETKLLEVALALLQKYFDEYPDDKFERSSAYTIVGDIYSIQKNYDLSLENYKNAMDFEKKYPSVKTEAYIHYSELVIQLNKTNLFKDVKNILLKKSEETDFPVNKYTKNSILSIIYKQENDLQKAEYHKKLAEEAAIAESSGFRWHKKLGLVKNRNKLLDKLMY